MTTAFHFLGLWMSRQGQGVEFTVFRCFNVQKHAIMHPIDNIITWATDHAFLGWTSIINFNQKIKFLKFFSLRPQHLRLCFWSTKTHKCGQSPGEPNRIVSFELSSLIHYCRRSENTIVTKVKLQNSSHKVVERVILLVTNTNHVSNCHRFFLLSSPFLPRCQLR